MSGVLCVSPCTNVDPQIHQPNLWSIHRWPFLVGPNWVDSSGGGFQQQAVSCCTVAADTIRGSIDTWRLTTSKRVCGSVHGVFICCSHMFLDWFKGKHPCGQRVTMGVERLFCLFPITWINCVLFGGGAVRNTRHSHLPVAQGTTCTRYRYLKSLGRWYGS